jgi:Na+/melibiose symporter-like transporter
VTVPDAARGPGQLARRLAYAGVYAPFSILHAPALAVLPALYARYAHLHLVFIGMVLTLARVLDCVLDPVIGFASDRTRSRFGRRKPWIAAGAVVSAVAAYFLFRPTAATGGAYFAIWYFLMYLGWTFGEIPHTAWINELSTDYDERSRLAAYRSGAGFVGMLLFQLCAFMPWLPGTEITPAVTAIASWLVIGLMPITVLWALYRLHDVEGPAAHRSSFISVLRGVKDNRPFWIFTAASACSQMASGMVAALFFFYLQDYLGIGDKFAHIQIIALLMSLVGIAFWLRAMVRLGKHRTLAICCLFTLLTLVGMAFVRPGPGAFPVLFTLFAISAFTSSGNESAGWSMMADVVDYGTLRTGERRAGNYYAVTSFTAKISLAAGGGVALIIAGLFGFSAEHANGPAAMRGFFLAFIAIPIVLNGIAAVCAVFYPLDSRRQSIVHRRLLSRERLAAAAAASIP